MNNESVIEHKINTNKEIDAPHDTAHYDPHIVPAEVAARKEREGTEFMNIPDKEDDQNQEIEGKSPSDSIDTTGGYTVDQEGLLNNYAIEPEMYVNEPGDLRGKQEDQFEERVEELKDLNEDEQGKLTMDKDVRPKGPGLI